MVPLGLIVMLLLGAGVVDAAVTVAGRESVLPGCVTEGRAEDGEAASELLSAVDSVGVVVRSTVEVTCVWVLVTLSLVGLDEGAVLACEEEPVSEAEEPPLWLTGALEEWAVEPQQISQPNGRAQQRMESHLLAELPEALELSV